ncbi:MAG: hypothetical protein V4493_00280 [Pseudomonadota bacterium]
MSKAIGIARGIGIVLVLVTYAVLVHHVNVSGQASVLAAILALAPLCLLMVSYAWQTDSRAAGISLLVASCIVGWLVWPFVRQHTDYMFWLQDSGLMLMLLLTFGRTLQKGRKPLCVHFAEIINGGEALTLAHAHYARQVTVAWVMFFAIIIIISSVLFFLAPLATWSVFVNFLTLPLVGLMFLAEFMVRRRVLTGLPTGRILDAVRAYLNSAARAR